MGNTEETLDTVFDFDFLLQDRIQKIQSINSLYDLENNAYIAFSGGKDSTVLSKLIDLALPNNKIPRVFINTGVEFKDIVSFVKESQKEDNRIVVVNAGVNLKEMLNDKGYPFKSKIFAHNLRIYQTMGMTNNVKRYYEDKKYGVPKKLRSTFTPDFTLKVSEHCCDELKKKPIHKWALENNKTINVNGMRTTEGGGRRMHPECTTFNSDKTLKSFSPLKPCEDNFVDWFVNSFSLSLCKLYYPPFNFSRTGCKGCPFSLDLKDQLHLMGDLLPNEQKQCEILWGPVYSEYRRLNYRID